jgi:hypothetical protein
MKITVLIYMLLGSLRYAPYAMPLFLKNDNTIWTAL